jgi:biopolymer transport protein ExbB
MLDALIDVFIKGGPVLVPIFLLGFLAWYLVADRFLVLRENTVPDKATVRKVLERFAAGLGPPPEAKAQCCGLYREIVLAAFQHKKGSVAAIQDSVDAIMLDKWPALTSRFGTIGVLAGALPLLGLLGTVTGMIHTFDTIMLFGAGNPVFLAGGISEALLTTEAGLIMTFPLLLALNVLQNRKSRLAAEIEYVISAVLNIVNKERLNAGKI